jgi:AraC-like DNA-binding protein
MKIRQERMAEFVSLVEKHTQQDGICQTSIDNLVTYRETRLHTLVPYVYEPGIVIGAQGKKHVYLDGKRYDYSAGNFMSLFVPMPVECELVEASPEKPLLGIGIYFDRNRLANMLLKLDMIDQPDVNPDTHDASILFSGPINDSLLDAAVRLLSALGNPGEAAILGESIIDEIYFRVLSDKQGGRLAYHLQQRGHIQQISRAVEYVHQNLEKPISVEELADIVHMSSSGFHKKFKEVMHLSPLQYAKSIKLNRAQTYILEGKNASEAGYMVGYNSPAQFSREYKRHFGFVPSATS